MSRLESRLATQRSGLTLLELLIATVLLVIITGIAMQFSLRAQELARQDTQLALLQARAMQVVEQAVDDIRNSGASQVVPAQPLGTEIPPGVGSPSTLDFYQVTGLVAGTGAQYSANPLSLQLELSEGEQPNGLDDDGDGLVDELTLSKISEELDDAGNPIIAPIATNVKGYDDAAAAREPGFRCRRIPGTDRLRLALTLQDTDRHGNVYEATYRSSVTLRNQ